MKTPTSRPVVLCLSGHDPSGGAGLQADIEALLAQGCHAAPAVTALTVQDTVNVSDFRVLDREWVLAQANAVLADLPVAAVKLGMLGSLEMVDTVAEILAAHPHLPVVCDPVLRAGGGGCTCRSPPSAASARYRARSDRPRRRSGRRDPCAVRRRVRRRGGTPRPRLQRPVRTCLTPPRLAREIES
ncbi:hydrogenase [Pseudomonas aeruginosa VRFPA09]|nr:hydrogenase [Pseudomonas aeruginosa VRFPA09]